MLHTGAAYIFYRTKCEEKALKRKGKADEQKIFRRRHERISRVNL
jgi:hypothetical protein